VTPKCVNHGSKSGWGDPGYWLQSVRKGGLTGREVWRKKKSSKPRTEWTRGVCYESQSRLSKRLVVWRLCTKKTAKNTLDPSDVSPLMGQTRPGREKDE